MEKKLLGVYVEDKLFNYITLLAVANGVTKSAILKDIIKDNVKNCKLRCSENSLLKNIAFKCKIKETPFDEITVELCNKGIDKTYINQVIEEIKKLNEENSRSVRPSQSKN